MILIYSTLKDPHALAVERILRAELGEPAAIIDLAQFPTLIRMVVRAGGGRLTHELRLPDGTLIDQDDVRAVWWRRPQPFVMHRDVRAADLRRFAAGECSAAFNGFWLNSHCLWVNPINEDMRASRKVHQLAVAQEIGLRVPQTLITNEPKEALRFWQEQRGQVVYKTFMGIEEAWRETRLLKEQELLFLTNVRYAPVIFQEYVPAGVDLRVIVIGNRVFAAEIDSQSGSYGVDVRMDMTVACGACALPRAVEAALLRLMDVFGLEYGAIDMRRTPEGEHYFLEINPAGQYLYIERLAGIPISRALATHLAAGRPRRENRNQKSGPWIPSAGEAPNSTPRTHQ